MSGRPDFDDPAPDLEPSPQEEPLDLLERDNHQVHLNPMIKEIYRISIQ